MVAFALSARPPESQAASRGAPVQVVSAVQSASARTGVDFSYLMEKAAVESGYRTDVKAATSSATGLFQFIESTWLDMVQSHGAKHGLGRYAGAIQRDRNGDPFVANPALRREILDLRKDPRASALMAGELVKENKQALETALGRPVGNTDLYLAHFLGAGGAATFLKAMDKDPHRGAAPLLPEAARANRNVFYDKSGRTLSLGQIYDRFAGKFGGEAQFADSSPFGAVQGDAPTHQPWASSRSAATGQEPISTFTVMVLNALAPPMEKEKRQGNPGVDGEEDRPEGDAVKTPNLLAGAFA